MTNSQHTRLKDSGESRECAMARNPSLRVIENLRSKSLNSFSSLERSTVFEERKARIVIFNLGVMDTFHTFALLQPLHKCFQS